MSDERIVSHLPNENYRRGWDETFGRARVVQRQFDDALVMESGPVFDGHGPKPGDHVVVKLEGTVVDTGRIVSGAEVVDVNG